MNRFLRKIKQLFCKHEWHTHDTTCRIPGTRVISTHRTKWCLKCNKAVHIDGKISCDFYFERLGGKQ